MSTPFATKTGTEFPASEAAQNYLVALMTEKGVSQGYAAKDAETRAANWVARNNGKRHVSTNIDRLKAEGFTGKTAAPVKIETVVPAGRYAVVTEDGATNELAFYKVDCPSEGRWAGYVFVKLMISDDEQRLSKAAGQAVLAKIKAVGPEAASAAYGQHIGECGICGKTLTNDDSRARGIGPTCRAKMGW